MSSNSDVKPKPLMARIDVTDAEWTAVRMAALAANMTTQKWLGDLIREKLAA